MNKQVVIHTPLYDFSARMLSDSSLDATIAQLQNASKKEQCERRRKYKAERGKFVSGRPPYGYRINLIVFGGLEVIPEEAEVIRLIFQLYVEQRTSVGRIIHELDAANYSFHGEGGRWTQPIINRILVNTTYAGYFHYNKSKRLERNRFEARPQHEWIRIECEPLISQALFDGAQAIREENIVRGKGNFHHE